MKTRSGGETHRPEARKKKESVHEYETYRKLNGARGDVTQRETHGVREGRGLMCERKEEAVIGTG